MNLIKKSDRFKNLVRLIMQFLKFNNSEKAKKFEDELKVSESQKQIPKFSFEPALTSKISQLKNNGSLSC